MIKLQAPSQIITHDEELKVFRNAKTIYVDGKPLPPPQEGFCITCNIQPLNGRQLLLVPEADRYKEQYWVYMNNLAQPLEINDRVTRCGLDYNNCPIDVNFQVQEVQHWGSYTKARIMRIDTGRSATP